MDQTAIQPGSAVPKPAETAVTTGPPPIGGIPQPSARPAKQPVHPVYQALVWTADLRLTVTLFALSMVLVFWGTLAQTDNGVWTIMQKYFRSAIVWVPLKVAFFNLYDDTKTVFPFPGGWLLGGTMLVNLLAAHAIRFKLTWNRAGIIMIHAGIIIMMLGELVTGLYAVEGQMRITEGQTVNSVIDGRSSEIAIVRTIDSKNDDVVTVPSALLKNGAVITDDKIPFKIEVIEFMVNSKLLDGANDRATKGFGRVHVAKKEPEVSGVEVGQQIDTPSVYVRLTVGKESDVWLLSTRFADPQWLEVNGKKYQLSLRFKQTTRPFTMHLTKFDHEVFLGDPNKTKDYRSHIHLVHKDKDNDVERDVEIYMNAPLYYNGETFYQSGMDKDERGVITTTLQVVRNPGWVMPYLSCAVVGLGLLIHFGLTLYRFIDRRIVR